MLTKVITMAFATTVLFFIFYRIFFSIELCTFWLITNLSINFSTQNNVLDFTDAFDSATFFAQNPFETTIKLNVFVQIHEKRAPNAYLAPVAMVKTKKSMVIAAKFNTN